MNEQVTVNTSGEPVENNFVNPTYRGDQRVAIINTSSVSGAKPVSVSLLIVHRKCVSGVTPSHHLCLFLRSQSGAYS